MSANITEFLPVYLETSKINDGFDILVVEMTSINTQNVFMTERFHMGF